MSSEIERLLKECLELKDKKQCPKCFKEIDKDMKFCPECGAKQEDRNPAKEVEVIEKAVPSEEAASSKDFENEENVEENEKAQTNLEKTTEIEINPDSQNITEEEMKNIGQ